MLATSTELIDFNMNVFTHDHNLADPLRRAKRMQYSGAICVLISFVMSVSAGFSPILLYVAYPLLLVGLPLWSIGRSSMRKLTAGPRSDALITAELKGFNDKYSLHHYPMVGGTRIEHLVVTPNGLIVMQSSIAIGPIGCIGGETDKWKSNSNTLDRITGSKPAIGNPTLQLNTAIGAVKQLLAQAGKPDVPVTGLVVFTRNPDIVLDSCTYPAVPLNETKQAVRELQQYMTPEREDTAGVNALLTSDDRRRLNILLNPPKKMLPAKAAPAGR